MNPERPARRRLVDRLLAGPRPPRPFREPRPYPRPRRGRFGMWGPIPYYSRRTRSGSEMSVGGCGCCLPIPILVVAGLFGLVRLLVRAVTSPPPSARGRGRASRG